MTPAGTQKRLRLFIALDLPGAVRREVGRWAREACGDPLLRPTPEGALHVTLAFLGSRPESEVRPLAALLASLREEPPRMRFTGTVGVPRRRPKLFALDAEADEVAALHARLVAAGREAGLIEPEQRQFWPHVTVARVRGDSRGGGRPARVADPPGGPPASLQKPFRAVRVTLYRSLTNPAGAEYVPLAQAELPERAAVR